MRGTPSVRFSRYLPWLAAGMAGAIVVGSGWGAVHAEDDDGKADVDNASGVLKREILRNYEHRIRAMSQPDKVFTYFASVTRDGEKLMTPADLLRSLFPYKPGTDSSAAELGKLLGVGADGLVSFSEYMFLVRLLATPERRLRLAFTMFDTNGDGQLSREEFESAVRAQAGDANSALVRRAAVSDALLRTLFGSKSYITFKRFAEFVSALQHCIVKAEFAVYDRGAKGYLLPVEFGRYLAAHASVSQADSLRQHASSMATPDSPAARLPLSDFEAFQRVLAALDDVDEAVRLAVSSVSQIDREILRRALRAAAGGEPSAVVLDTLWHMFGGDDNGFDYNRFASVMRRAKAYELDRPRDTGVIRAAERLWQCVQREVLHRV